jgi:hypothetical protein
MASIIYTGRICDRCYNRNLLESGFAVDVRDTYYSGMDDLSTDIQSSGCILHWNDELSPAPQSAGLERLVRIYLCDTSITLFVKKLYSLFSNTI